MTVKELMEELMDLDPNMEVKFAYNYGDYWGTEVASNIRDVDEGMVKYSSYHKMDKVTDYDDEDDSIKTVVIIK